MQQGPTKDYTVAVLKQLLKIKELHLVRRVKSELVDLFINTVRLLHVMTQDQG